MFFLNLNLFSSKLQIFEFSLYIAPWNDHPCFGYWVEILEFDDNKKCYQAMLMTDFNKTMELKIIF